MIRAPHLRLIAGHSVKHGVRGGAGLVSILLTLVVGLSMAALVVSPLEDLEEMKKVEGLDAEVSAMLDGEVIRIARKAIDFAVDPTKPQLDYLTRDQPAMVSAILVLLIVVAPLLACMGGFNQTSGDIGSKGLRFLLIRTERPNIFLGRFIGTALFHAVVMLTLFVILGLYMGAKVKVHPTGDMVAWLFQGYLRLMIFSLPYIALCAWVSCAIDSPFGALVIALLVTYLVPLMVLIGRQVNDVVGYLGFITPWGFKWMLMQPIGPQLLGGMAAMLGFTALFVFAGLTYFSKRDL